MISCFFLLKLKLRVTSEEKGEDHNDTICGGVFTAAMWRSQTMNPSE